MTIISRKDAKAAGLPYYFTGRPCKHGHIDARRTSVEGCVTCHRERKRINKLKCYAENPERFRELGRVDYQRHPDRYKKNAYLRQSRLKQATPPWVTDEMIYPFYIERQRLTAETGIPHDVDHIYPLKPKDGTYCGLNVPANLQVIPASENRSKQNRWFGARYSRSGK